MNKKILASIMVVGLLALAMGWGTYSYFSDTETSTGNTFTAGTLDLQVGSDLPINIGPMKPGDSNHVIIALTNDGTINGQLSVLIGTGSPWNVVQTMVQSEGDNPEPETDTTKPGDLGKYLVFDVEYDADNDGTYEDQGWPNWGPGSVFPTLESCNGETLDFGTLPAGATRNVKISWNLPTSVGNDVMGDTVTFDITFYLTQA